jgi:hypothetical protein
MYSSSEESCQKAFDNALLLALKSFGNFLKYLQQCFARKIDWCFANRKSVINRSHNTNNLAETNFRLIKDIILGRLKAPNAVSLLLSFICFEFDDYYCRRLTDVAFGRGLNKNNLYKVVCDKAKQLIDKFKVAFEKVEDANKFKTGTQLASFFATALERHKRGGKIIPVQPMNINRRKSSSRSRRVLRCGRPLQGVKVAVKRKRGLSQNIAQNQRNAKSHGNAH